MSGANKQLPRDDKHNPMRNSSDEKVELPPDQRTSNISAFISAVKHRLLYLNIAFMNLVKY